MALHANEFCVLATITAEGDEAESVSAHCEEQADAPGDSNTADLFAGDLSSILATGSARGTRRAVVSCEVDDHGPLLGSRGRWIVGGRCAVGSRSSVGRCSVCRWRWCVHFKD